MLHLSSPLPSPTKQHQLVVVRSSHQNQGCVSKHRFANSRPRERASFLATRRPHPSTSMAGGSDCAQRVAWGFGVGSTLGASIGETPSPCRCARALSSVRCARLARQPPRRSHEQTTITTQTITTHRRALRHVRGIQKQGACETECVRRRRRRALSLAHALSPAPLHSPTHTTPKHPGPGPLQDPVHRTKHPEHGRGESSAETDRGDARAATSPSSSRALCLSLPLTLTHAHKPPLSPSSPSPQTPDNHHPTPGLWRLLGRRILRAVRQALMTPPSGNAAAEDIFFCCKNQR